MTSVAFLSENFAGILAAIGAAIIVAFALLTPVLLSLIFPRRKTLSGAERTKVSSQASGDDRVEPKQEINPSNGDEQP